MHKIWKYRLELTDKQVLSVPVGATFISAGVARGQVCVWGMFDFERFSRNSVYEDRSIVISGTGHVLEDVGKLNFIGTVVNDPFVWHVFEKIE